MPHPQSMETGNNPCYADEYLHVPLAEQEGSVAGCAWEETSVTFPPLEGVQRQQEQEEGERNEGGT